MGHARNGLMLNFLDFSFVLYIILNAVAAEISQLYFVPASGHPCLAVRLPHQWSYTHQPHQTGRAV